jgi:hypothetical protein
MSVTAEKNITMHTNIHANESCSNVTHRSPCPGTNAVTVVAVGKPDIASVAFRPGANGATKALTVS